MTSSTLAGILLGSLSSDGVGHDLFSPILRHPTSTPRRFANLLVSPTRRAHPAFQRASTRQGTSNFPPEPRSTQLLRVRTIRVGHSLVRMHSQDQSDNKHPVERVAEHSSACTINLERSPQLSTSRTSRDCKSYPGSEEGKTLLSTGS